MNRTKNWLTSEWERSLGEHSLPQISSHMASITYHLPSKLLLSVFQCFFSQVLDHVVRSLTTSMNWYQGTTHSLLFLMSCDCIFFCLHSHGLSYFTYLFYHKRKMSVYNKCSTVSTHPHNLFPLLIASLQILPWRNSL